jgi:hypothetical protein
MNRRHFLASALAASLSSVAAREGRAPRLVLRSSWQTVNIGDIAHTPGVLRLLEEHLPEARCGCGRASIGNGVDALLRRAFPSCASLKSRRLRSSRLHRVRLPAARLRAVAGGAERCPPLA